MALTPDPCRSSEPGATADAGAAIDDDSFAGSAYPTPAESPGLLLWRATNAWQRRQRAALAPLGLTHLQFVLLACLAWLARGGEGVTQTRLARFAGSDPMMTSQVLRTLADRGLLERHHHPADARAILLVPTETGTALVRQALPLVEAVDTSFFAPLDDLLGDAADLLRRLATEPAPSPTDEAHSTDPLHP